MKIGWIKREEKLCVVCIQVSRSIIGVPLYDLDDPVTHHPPHMIDLGQGHIPEEGRTRDSPSGECESPHQRRALPPRYD